MRSCSGQLARTDRGLVCPRSHAFDRARAGHFNLLQPQDRRSRRAGDDPRALEARARLHDAGLTRPLVDATRAELLARPPRALLDVGCGDGRLLAAAVEGLGCEVHALDLSAAAAERTARRLPDATVVVANADRVLPYADASLDVVLSVNSRLNPPETRRVLRADGRLGVALPGPDDLLELRAAVLGEARRDERGERALAALAGVFALVERRDVRTRARLGPELLRDALAATYRGARRSAAGRAAALGEMDVTLSWELLWLRPA